MRHGGPAKRQRPDRDAVARGSGTTRHSRRAHERRRSRPRGRIEDHVVATRVPPVVDGSGRLHSSRLAEAIGWIKWTARRGKGSQPIAHLLFAPRPAPFRAGRHFHAAHRIVVCTTAKYLARTGQDPQFCARKATSIGRLLLNGGASSAPIFVGRETLRGRHPSAERRPQLCVRPQAAPPGKEGRVRPNRFLSHPLGCRSAAYRC
jgi:hypothetical protein